MKLLKKSGFAVGDVFLKVLIVLAVLAIVSIIIWQSRGVMTALIDKIFG